MLQVCFSKCADSLLQKDYNFLSRFLQKFLLTYHESFNMTTAIAIDLSFGRVGRIIKSTFCHCLLPTKVSLITHSTNSPKLLRNSLRLNILERRPRHDNFHVIKIHRHYSAENTGSCLADGYFPLTKGTIVHACGGISK